MKKLVSYIGIVVVIMGSSWALFHPHLFRIHDYVHAARIVEMQRALSDGHFPARWSQHFGYGYGMPLFEFYAPLPYYFGAVLSWLGIPVTLTVKSLFFISNVGTAIGAYLLGKKLFGRRSGLVVSAAVTLAPYRAVNLFVRGAVSETWGIMAIPWILYGVVKVVHHEKTGWLWLTASLVILMLSHNIMTMLFIPFMLLFGALYVGYLKWVVQKNTYSQLHIFIELLLSLLLAAGVAAFYLFPAVLEKDFTKVSDIFGGYFHYSQHFLYLRQLVQVNWGYTGSVWGPGDGISFFLGWGQIFAVVIALMFGGIILVRTWRQKGLSAVSSNQRVITGVLLGLLSIIALFLTLSHAAPIWQALPILAYAQFPWRFLGIAIVFISLIGGFSVSLLSNHYYWQTVLSLVLFVLLCFNAQFFRPESYLTNDDSLYYTDEGRIEEEMSQILPDYIPVQMADELNPPQDVAWCTPECQNDLTVLVDDVHQKLVETDFEQQQLLELAVADFPGWQLELDGQRVTGEQAAAGNLQLTVPAGHHVVGARFGATPIRLVSDLVSLVSVMVLAVLFIHPERKSV